MPSVSVHPPKTPITKGSNGIAQATLPNVCKMPGPPAPFVPSPLPNIAKSGMSPDGYSTSVTIEGNAVCIFGASFQSMGDDASKGTGGGLLSANTGGPVKFIAPGSLTVKIEGQAVHLLGDAVLNNLGGGGAPPNTGATMGGTMQGTAPAAAKVNLECGEVGTYSKLGDKAAKPVDMERDHIPSKAALFKRAENLKPGMSDAEIGCVQNKLEARGMAIAIPRSSHRGFSPTCGTPNKTLSVTDAKSEESMKAATERDTSAMQQHMDQSHPECAEAYAKAAEKVKEHDTESMIGDAIDECSED